MYTPGKGKQTHLIDGAPADAAPSSSVCCARRRAHYERPRAGPLEDGTLVGDARRSRRQRSVMILVIAEQRVGTLNPVTWETIAAGQALDGPLSVAVAGANVGSSVEALAAADVAEVLAVDNVALEPYTPDGFVGALAQVVEQVQPSLVLFPHTYQTRDYAPALAARLGRTLMTDCIGSKSRRWGSGVRASNVPRQVRRGRRRPRDHRLTSPVFKSGRTGRMPRRVARVRLRPARSP